MVNVGLQPVFMYFLVVFECESVFFIPKKLLHLYISFFVCFTYLDPSFPFTAVDVSIRLLFLQFTRLFMLLIKEFVNYQQNY
jgi:hypothetical protein